MELCWQNWDALGQRSMLLRMIVCQECSGTPEDARSASEAVREEAEEGVPSPEAQEAIEADQATQKDR